jgi:putative tRNA adenosine deaminase-associated protein
VSYFTAVIATDAWGWRARDVSVDDAETLEDLADRLRAAAVADAPVLAILEREDDWFALVRVDGDDEPRVFVSDLDAATRGHFGPLLSTAAELSGDAQEQDGYRPDDEDEQSGRSPAPSAAGSAPAGAAAGVGVQVGERDDPPPVGTPDDAAEDDVGDDGVGSGSVIDEDPLDGDEAVDETVDDEAGAPSAWAGDPDLLADLGFPGERLRRLAEDDSDDPASAIAEIGEEVGFYDRVEALR